MSYRPMGVNSITGKTIIYVLQMGATYVMFEAALHSSKGIMWGLFGIWAIVSFFSTVVWVMLFVPKEKVA